MICNQPAPTIEINDLFLRTQSEPAARRIAAGTMRIRRDSNPQRSSAITFAHLGKLNPIDVSHVQDLMTCFAVLANEVSSSRSVCIIGLAESGIVPSYAMHQVCLTQGRTSRWFCSSRIDQRGLAFCEPHSHSPNHYLSPEVFSESFEELWIVEDEITTGQTLTNLLNCVREMHQVHRTRIFTLFDTRDPRPNCMPGPFHEPVQVQSVLKTSPKYWEAERFAAKIETDTRPRHFVAGEAIATALPDLMAKKVPLLQHLTFSPWMVDGGYVRTRKQLACGHFVYNVENFWRP